MKFLLFFLIPALALAGTMPPERNQLDNAKSLATSSLSREQRILLASYFPKIFPIRFLCQFRPAKGEPSVVVPGDTVDAPEGGTMVCPDKLEFALSAKTRIRIEQMGSTPLVRLEEGALGASFPQLPLFIETETMELSLLGTGKQQRLSIAKSENGETLACERGAVAADIHEVNAKTKHFLESRQCRMETTIDRSAVKRYLLAEENVLAANLLLPRTFWPPTARVKSEKLGIVLSIAPNQPIAAPFKVQWMIPGEFAAMSCTLFSQRNDADEAKEVQKIAVKAGPGEAQLEAIQRSAYLSMVCDDDTNTIASNVVLPPMANTGP